MEIAIIFGPPKTVDFHISDGHDEKFAWLGGVIEIMK